MKNNYRYFLRQVMAFMAELMSFVFKAFIYWPSFIVGAFITLFFLLGFIDGVIFRNGATEYHLFNILSDLAQAYQSAPPGKIMVEVCSYHYSGIDLPGGSTSENVCTLTREARTVANIAAQVIQFANSVYCILVVVAGCIEALIRYGYSFTRFSSLSRRCEPVVCEHGSYSASRHYPHRDEDKVDE
ncbi:hypothetical protein ACULN0_19845 [Pectobacterium actinidiae]|uniref:hypothetical protein n=1 Tax=Pectobacterium actinidiae TaxID=1507808 RepID=UPI0040408F75